VCEVDRLKGLGYRSDLVKLNEDRISSALLNAIGESLHVSYEEIISNELHGATDLLGHKAPSVPVVLVEAILDGAPAIPSAADGLRRTQVIDACYRSSAEGREIRL
jgi:predicted dehydrogenase